MIAYIPLIVAIAGLLLYALADANKKAAEVGRLAYFAGLLVTLFMVANKSIAFLR
jgi:hypothetical protein